MPNKNKLVKTWKIIIVALNMVISFKIIYTEGKSSWKMRKGFWKYHVVEFLFKVPNCTIINNISIMLIIIFSVVLKTFICLKRMNEKSVFFTFNINENKIVLYRLLKSKVAYFQSTITEKAELWHACNRWNV